MKPANISLVLSSGGARGLVHIGAIEALEEAGFRITAVAGTSMGALVGGMFACGSLNDYRKFMTGLTRLDVIWLMDLAVSKTGIIKGERVFHEMKHFIGTVQIEDLPIPFAAVAADISNHKEVVFKEGDLLTAIRASSAIPSVLMPVSKDGALLVDGGVVNPLPMEHVALPEGNLLVAVNVNAPRIDKAETEKEEKIPEEHHDSVSDSVIERARQLINQKWNSMTGNHKERTHVSGIFTIVNNSFELMQHKLTLNALERQTPDIILNIPVNVADTFDFHRAKELIALGYEEMKAELKKTEKLRSKAAKK
ncbi:patatin-like phospholipase family protein [Lentimicrobium sp.]|mgnify:CR=1 FL=1|uniref:patatin-like phospholipase family protein n=2 Tax=Lentimicrobium sp. TaxID=2034841 RepID=UPI002BE7DD94|nr:patatin-like phospholipase family protein [Lentimicrobium sp.]HRW70611.1 patatin-like phospholipase family protein [Lentimicrobium sp.]